MSSQEEIRARALDRCRSLGVVIPTLDQMRNPASIPANIVEALGPLDMQRAEPLNLFRISWHNHPGGGFGEVNALVIEPELSGVPCRIVGLLGDRFPTHAHKVGAAFGCLAPRLVRGHFDPTTQVAVWPSTGNYCRGGVFDSKLLGCRSLAILPEEMSRERFDWLESMGAEVLATPGSESNVKEIFDACWTIRENRPEAMIFNQFEELGNSLWHMAVTAPAAIDAFKALPGKRNRLAGWVSATGSAGTIAAGDVIKRRFPGATVTAAEALQCPTLLNCGFGAHRIEGIGDKHVPWIHNVRSTDMVTAIDDESTVALLRLFNEDAGRDELSAAGLSDATINSLVDLGLSSICNLLAAIKTARHYELDSNDVLMTSFTDSARMYLSRLDELNATRGDYTRRQAAIDLEHRLLGCATDHLAELRYTDRKALHNLKYFTWVEQQGRDARDLDALWSPSFWVDLEDSSAELDADIESFNLDSGAVAGRPCPGATA